MKKFLVLISLSAMVLAVNAQPMVSPIEPFGKIDKADLEMQSCDFEKDANAEVLFDQGIVDYIDNLTTLVEHHHRRIKIFNDNGKGESDIHITYHSGNHAEFITGLQAETINLINGKVEITKLDKGLVYNRVIDKNWSEMAFSMPNVKSGSVIDLQYNWNTGLFYNFPDWSFQYKIPVKYSEFETRIPDIFDFRPYCMPSTLLSKLFPATIQGRCMVTAKILLMV